MKLLTLNTHSWQETQQDEKLTQTIKAIAEQDFDVIALQEINQHQDSENLKYSNFNHSNAPIKQDNYAYLIQQDLKELGLNYHLSWDFVHVSYDVYQEGLAFLTKSPILEHEVIDLSNDYDESFWKFRRAVKIKIQHQGQNINLFNCHLGWWDDAETSFQSQIDMLMESQTGSSKNGELSFYLGDFNNPAHIRNQGYDYLKQQGLIDTFELAQTKDSGITVIKAIDGWDSNSEKLRLDLILANQKINVKTNQVIFNGENYPVVSDHFGVMVEVEF